MTIIPVDIRLIIWWIYFSIREWGWFEVQDVL